MKRFFGVLALVLTMISVAKAQNRVYKNALRVGVDYLTLDAPDDLGYRYLGRYARHLGNDRIVLEASLGYLKVANNRSLPNAYVFQGRARKRITADFTASFDFVKSSQHALRLGIGPSVWYREDDRWESVDYLINPDGSAAGISIKNRQINEVNLGGSAVAEYEFAATERLMLGARLGLTTFKTASISSLAGLNLGYRF
ncbi:hypothetical protein GCM10027299_42950 [Larkinella ripae]